MEPVLVGELLEYGLREDIKIFAMSVRKAAEECGSKTQLAKKTLLSPSTISRLMKGVGRPTAETYSKLFPFVAKYLPEGIWIGLNKKEQRRKIRIRKYKF